MQMQCILLASTVVALSLIPVGALAQAVNEPSATFNERYPAEPAEPQTPEQLPSNGQPTGTAQQKKTPEQVPSNAQPTGTSQQKSTEQPTGTVQSKRLFLSSRFARSCSHLMPALRVTAHRAPAPP
jgi:hypothetical protein